MTGAALDACLCLLLISAAAVTVTSAPVQSGVDDPDRADAVAETLTAVTADVPYTLRPVPNGDGEPDASPEYDRVAHGTLATLLADAAVRTVRVGGEALTGTSEGFAAAVRETVAERLPSRTRVVVRWQPYPDAHLGRAFAVGPTPPAGVDVNAATVRAPSGVDTPENASATAGSGFDRLGRGVADAIVTGLLPPEKGRLALDDDAPLDDLVRHRYRRASRRYGVDTATAIDRGNTRSANRRIASAMAERVADDLRQGASSPNDALDSLELDTVEISVRTWSP